MQRRNFGRVISLILASAVLFALIPGGPAASAATAAKLVTATSDDKARGDIDGNGKIEVNDALAILRVAAKLADASSLG